MLPAANILPTAQTGIERYLMQGRRELKELDTALTSAGYADPKGGQRHPAQAQRLFSLLRLRFNAVLTQFDLFNERAHATRENEIGVWLSGLDVVSADALRLAAITTKRAVICYLDRGVGAAYPPGADATSGRRRQSGRRHPRTQEAWWAAGSRLRWFMKWVIRPPRCSIW